MVVFVKTFNYYHPKFNFGNFFSCPVKLLKNLKLKFRLKFSHAFMVIYSLYTILILLRRGLFSGLHMDCGTKKVPIPKICLTYPTVMTLGTTISYPKKTEKIYKSRDTTWVLLTSAYFLGKSANLAIPRNTDIDCIWTHNF